MKIVRKTFLLTILLALFIACNKPKPPSTDYEIFSKNVAASTIVIFVHGVLGDAIETFGQAPEVNWPNLLGTDPALEVATDVLSVAYNSGPIQTSSNINEIATRVLSRLQDKKVFENHTNVIFIVHSMGGLITKRMLVQLKAKSPAEYEKVKAAFFLATPSGGSSLAQTAAWVSKNPQFADMKPLDVNTLLQVYEDDWSSLMRTRTQLAPYPKTYCIYETQPTGPFNVVPRSHAQTGCDESPIAFDRDHLGLVKPSSRNDEVYQHVIARIKRVVSGQYLPLHIKADLLGNDTKTLPANITMKGGDQFSINVSANKPAWFYIVSQDSSGKIEKLFPSENAGLQSSPISSLRVPSDLSSALELDKNKGLETFYIFASNERNLELEKLQLQVQNKSEAYVQGVLDVEIKKRGVVVAAKKQPQSNEPTPVNFNAGSIGTEAALVINIGHQ